MVEWPVTYAADHTASMNDQFCVFTPPGLVPQLKHFFSSDSVDNNCSFCLIHYESYLDEAMIHGQSQSRTAQ